MDAMSARPDGRPDGRPAAPARQLTALADRLRALVPHEGFHATALADVTLMRVDHSCEPVAVLQEPAIVLALQGLKRGYLGNEVLSYAAGQGLVVSLPMNFRCDTVVPGPGQPMLALQVRVDLETVRELVNRLVDAGLPGPSPASGRAMAVTPLDDAMLDTVDRLLSALGSRMDAAVLGPQLLRELHYRVLMSEAGGCLRELAQWQGRVGGVHRSIERLRARLDQDWQVAELAREAAMSPSAFHAAFKDVTGQSPMQYLKAVRLHRARELLAQTQRLASDVAFEVGYQSPSQFSRDYKRHFGASPSQARAA